MSSYPRRLQRKFLRTKGDYEGALQQSKPIEKNGGYMVLTATKGWKVFNGSRMIAQRMMGVLLDHPMRSVSQKVVTPATLIPPPAETLCKTPGRHASKQQLRDAHKAKMARKRAA